MPQLEGNYILYGMFQSENATRGFNRLTDLSNMNGEEVKEEESSKCWFLMIICCCCRRGELTRPQRQQQRQRHNHYRICIVATK